MTIAVYVHVSTGCIYIYARTYIHVHVSVAVEAAYRITSKKQSVVKRLINIYECYKEFNKVLYYIQKVIMNHGS